MQFIFNSFPVCPRRTDMSSNYIPSNPPLKMATDIGFCSSDFCSTTNQRYDPIN